MQGACWSGRERQGASCQGRCVRATPVERGWQSVGDLDPGLRVLKRAGGIGYP